MSVSGSLTVMSLGIFATQRRRYRRLSGTLPDQKLRASSGSILVLSLCTVMLGIAAVVFVTAGYGQDSR